MTDKYEEALKAFNDGCMGENINEWCEADNMMQARSGVYGFEFNVEQIETIRQALKAKEPDALQAENNRLNGLYGIIEGQKVIVSELEAEIDKYKWKPIDDYARSGDPVIIAYIDCSTISYAVCDYIDDIDGYLSFCTCSDRAEVFEDKILGYMPIPEFKENIDE
jgi:hypothetical protein